MDYTVNDLPIHDSYPVAITRSAEEIFPEAEIGSVKKSDKENRFLIKVDNVMMEFEIKDNNVYYNGLPTPNHGKTPSLASDIKVPPKKKLPKEQQEQPITPPSEQESGIPSIPEPPTILPSPQPKPGVPESPNEPKPTEPPKTEISYNNPEVIDKFYKSLSMDSKTLFDRLMSSGIQLYDISLSGESLTGKLKGSTESFNIKINKDISVELPAMAWGEFPQLLSYKK